MLYLGFNCHTDLIIVVPVWSWSDDYVWVYKCNLIKMEYCIIEAWT